MYITLDSYPDKGGCVLHLSDDEIDELLEDIDNNTSAGDQLRNLLERWMKGRDA